MSIPHFISIHLPRAEVTAPFRKKEEERERERERKSVNAIGSKTAQERELTKNLASRPDFNDPSLVEPSADLSAGQSQLMRRHTPPFAVAKLQF